MRIVFFGATELGYHCCSRLLEMGEQVVGLFSIPQQFRISYSPTPMSNVTFRDFGELARVHDLPLVYVSNMKDPEHRRLIEEWQPDFAMVIGWYYMVPRSLRQLFPKGVAGVHGSLLPKYRGGAPLVWSIISGEKQGGISLFYFEDGVDTGDVIGQKTLEIAETDTIRELYDKATVGAMELVTEFVPRIRLGTAPRMVQNQAEATIFPQRQPDDGVIDWNKLNAHQVYNWVRAQTRPYPGAFTWINGRKLHIWKVHVADAVIKGVPGCPIRSPRQGGEVLMGCSDGACVVLDEIQFVGETPLMGAACVRLLDSCGSLPLERTA